CLGCFSWYGDDDEDEGPPNPARRGLFSYSHMIGNVFSAPYGLTRRPRVPLHVDMLPPELRGTVLGFRIPSLCFATTPHIQPVDFDVCSSWEPAYMTVDGLRILENFDATFSDFAPDTYAEFYAEFTNPQPDWLKGVTVEPLDYDD